jgi:hypothetical protein
MSTMTFKGPIPRRLSPRRGNARFKLKSCASRSVVLARAIQMQREVTTRAVRMIPCRVGLSASIGRWSKEGSRLN